MKQTANAIYLKHTGHRPSWDIEEAMEEYAKQNTRQALEAFRTECAEKAKLSHNCPKWDCVGESIDKQSILSLDIEKYLK